MRKFELFIRALELRDSLSARERALILALPALIRHFSRDEEIVAIHSRPSSSCLLLDGFAARELFVEDGRRQVTAIHIAGDFVDLHSLLLKVMDHSVVALTRCTVAFIPHQDLIALADGSPHLGRLLWLSTVIDAAIQRAWIGAMGRRSALELMAHLLCETYIRLNAVGLAAHGIFQLPFTQSVLADILGLSVVHVSRTTRELRRTGLLSWQGDEITIHDFSGLAALGDFDPSYLNLVHEPR